MYTHPPITRYTDFLVNELNPDGTAVHLKSLSVPKRPTQAVGDLKSQVQAGKQDANSHPEDTGASKPTHNSEPDAVTTSEHETEDVRDSKKAEDLEILTSLLGDGTITQITNLHKAVLAEPKRKPSTFPTYTTNSIESRADRTEIHQLIRSIFSSRLDTVTGDDGTIAVTAARRPPSQNSLVSNTGPRGPNLLGWQAQGGEYLHFTLHKENKDTMEVLNFLAGQTRTRAKRFAFAGTKDRRAVTAQRCSVFRMSATQLHGVSKRLKNSAIGDYVHKPTGLCLGDLGGNAFVITLRDAGTANDTNLPISERQRHLEAVLTAAIPAFSQSGFLNYYGLQRFGSFIVPTHEIGKRMLQGDLASAIDALLSFSPSALAPEQDTKTSDDDATRARTIRDYTSAMNASPPDYAAAVAAAKTIPRKFTAEAQVTKWLSTKGGSKCSDYQGALMTLPRNLRLMYVHAYQSFVWNAMVSRRWELYGAELVEGDLVLVSEGAAEEEDGGVDQDGDAVVKHEDEARENIQRARTLSAEEAASGTWNVEDLVLPLPGFDVVYPANAVGRAYEEFMGSEEGGGLDPHGMRRGWKDVSLCGGYRRIVGRCLGDVKWEVRRYANVEEQLVETDLDRAKMEQAIGSGQRIVVGETEGETTEEAEIEAGATDGGKEMDGVEFTRPADADDQGKLAVILRLSLGPSTYATMALRELMGAGGCREYKPDFGGRGRR